MKANFTILKENVDYISYVRIHCIKSTLRYMYANGIVCYKNILLSLIKTLIYIHINKIMFSNLEIIPKLQIFSSNEYLLIINPH